MWVVLKILKYLQQINYHKSKFWICLLVLIFWACFNITSPYVEVGQRLYWSQGSLVWRVLNSGDGGCPIWRGDVFPDRARGLKLQVSVGAGGWQHHLKLNEQKTIVLCTSGTSIAPGPYCPSHTVSQNPCNIFLEVSHRGRIIYYINLNEMWKLTDTGVMFCPCFKFWLLTKNRIWNEIRL